MPCTLGCWDQRCREHDHAGRQGRDGPRRVSGQRGRALRIRDAGDGRRIRPTVTGLLRTAVSSGGRVPPEPTRRGRARPGPHDRLRPSHRRDRGIALLVSLDPAASTPPRTRRLARLGCESPKQGPSRAAGATCVVAETGNSRYSFGGRPAVPCGMSSSAPSFGVTRLSPILKQ